MSFSAQKCLDKTTRAKQQVANLQGKSVHDKDSKIKKIKFGRRQ